MTRSDWKHSITKQYNPMSVRRVGILQDVPNTDDDTSIEFEHTPRRWVVKNLQHSEVEKDWTLSREMMRPEDEEMIISRWDGGVDHEIRTRHVYNVRRMKGLSKIVKNFEFIDRESLSNVLINSISALKQGKVVTYIRRRTTTTRGNISTYRINKAIDYLGENGYLSLRTGRSSAIESLRIPSSYKPTEKFYEMMDEYPELLETSSKIVHSEKRPVILRNTRKKELTLPMSHRYMIDEMNNININNESHVVRSNGIIMRTSGTRIFTGKMEWGGRIYRNDIVQLSSRERLELTIDGEPVVECDYISMHVRMLMHMVGEDCPLDVYSLVFSGTYNEIDREVIKVAINILLNSPTLRKARNAIAYHMKNIGESMFTCEAHVLDEIDRAYSPIKDFFLSGIGRVLQRNDSDIAVRVMTRMANSDKFCIGAHDSFVTKAVDMEELVCIMREEYRNVMKFDTPVMSSIMVGGIKIREIHDNEVYNEEDKTSQP